MPPPGERRGKKQAENPKQVKVPMPMPSMAVDTSPTDFHPVEQMRMMRFDGERNVRFGPMIGAEFEKTPPPYDAARAAGSPAREAEMPLGED